LLGGIARDRACIEVAHNPAHISRKARRIGHPPRIAPIREKYRKL